MKPYLQEIVNTAPNPLTARNMAREYIQARILESLQREGAMIPLAFHGGTALRFLDALPRYSEDLDFALEGAREYYDFRGYAQEVRANLTAEGYAVALRVSDQKTVHSAFVRLPGLLHS
jgi:predicted nucleotidyltransferase component of viral defense system